MVCSKTAWPLGVILREILQFLASFKLRKSISRTKTGKKLLHTYENRQFHHKFFTLSYTCLKVKDYALNLTKYETKGDSKIPILTLWWKVQPKLTYRNLIFLSLLRIGKRSKVQLEQHWKISIYNIFKN